MVSQMSMLCSRYSVKGSKKATFNCQHGEYEWSKWVQFRNLVIEKYRHRNQTLKEIFDKEVCNISKLLGPLSPHHHLLLYQMENTAVSKLLHTISNGLTSYVFL